MFKGSKQSSFRGNRISVGRVKGREMIRREKISKARLHLLLSQLRKKGEMRCRPVVRKVFFAEIRFLEEK
jgi:hypothetical protein